MIPHTKLLADNSQIVKLANIMFANFTIWQFGNIPQEIAKLYSVDIQFGILLAGFAS
jgi:hypothetical protein